MSSPAAPIPSTTPMNPIASSPSGGGRGAVARGTAATRVTRAPAKFPMQRAETWLALVVVTVVALLIVPLPSPILDGLLALSLALSIVVLLVTLSTSDPLDFSIFPSLLLLLTLLRLGLNVNSTRLVLGQGDAGRVIDAFGSAVIGGNYIVGLVIFVILVVINFMVITKGAGRIAEVAARFTLDAMPGRQMSIDADLNAGLIDETEARRRREEIARYADFFGAMDGAAKFVRGDAVAGLIITGINLIGGFAIGMLQRDLSAADALTTYTRLTVGDGLVTQIPALVVSTSAGIIVTYGSTSSKVGPAMAQQLTKHPGAMWIAAGILGLLAVLPGFPLIPFALLAVLTGVGAWYSQQRAAEAQATLVSEREPTAQVEPESKPIKELLHVDPLELEVGYALVPLVDEGQDGDLLQRITLMRKQLAVELGVIVPPIRVRDNIQLPAMEYEIKMRGVRIARGEIMPKYLLALNSSGTAERMDGIHTTDPSFGMPAVWVPHDRRVEAQTNGYSVVEPQTVLSTHLMETVRQHAGDLLGRQESQELLDNLKEHAPALVEDLVPGKLSLGAVHRVLQRLLREGIPVRDLATILEALADSADQTKDVDVLTESVRRSLASVISQLYDDGTGTVRGFTVGPKIENALTAMFNPRTAEDAARSPSPEQLSGALESLRAMVAKHRGDGQRHPLIAPPHLRASIRRLVEPVLPHIAVVSLAELLPHLMVQSLATWELPNAS